VSSEQLVAGTIQIVVGLGLSPLLPGLIQNLKARLQGRRGPDIWQLYRELRRLWRKSSVTPVPHSLVYVATPVIVAGALLLAVLIVPVGGASPDWPVGHDALVLVGLFTLARFALALSAWDTGAGFGLMGAARDLAIAVSAEALLLLAVLLLALPSSSTSLIAISAAATDPGVWTEPAHWAAAAALVVMVLVETGRQPIDNPDTHLELTMIHEGPLLEYAGRDFAYLQWGSALRHWIVLALVTGVVIPQPVAFAWRIVILGCAMPLWCALLAFTETALAKMRLLRVPTLLGAAGALCLLGLATALVGGRP
jgi:formate hydrogenlyase subunit 4